MLPFALSSPAFSRQPTLLKSPLVIRLLVIFSFAEYSIEFMIEQGGDTSCSQLRCISSRLPVVELARADGVARDEGVTGPPICTFSSGDPPLGNWKEGEKANWFIIGRKDELRQTYLSVWRGQGVVIIYSEWTVRYASLYSLLRPCERSRVDESLTYNGWVKDNYKLVFIVQLKGYEHHKRMRMLKCYGSMGGKKTQTPLMDYAVAAVWYIQMVDRTWWSARWFEFSFNLLQSIPSRANQLRILLELVSCYKANLGWI